MSKGITSQQLEAVSGSQVKTRELYSIVLDDGVIRCLANDTIQSLTINDQQYLSGYVKRTDIETSDDQSVQKCTVTFSNVWQELSAIISNDGDVITGKTCVIEEVIFNPDTNAILSPGLELFSGIINNIQLTQSQFTFTVERSVASSQATAPMTTYDVSCQWRFKDTRCGYTGSLSRCDKTFNTCRNQNNYGGYPAIPEAMQIRAR